MVESRGSGGAPVPLQRVLNESWPLTRKDGTKHANGIPDRDPIPVRVRLVFERDGEVFVDGRAQRWTPTHVFVAVGDPRIQIGAVWVAASDVRRR